MRVISRFDFELHNPPTRHGITHSYGNLSAGRRPQGGLISSGTNLSFPSL